MLRLGITCHPAIHEMSSLFRTSHSVLGPLAYDEQWGKYYKNFEIHGSARGARTRLGCNSS